ncbi:hypothetical protein SAMN05216436_1404 [bacterium A37T11]|nr:hypothetical protein SAMN05216436_1404 [bacterium A37T11]
MFYYILAFLLGLASPTTKSTTDSKSVVVTTANDEGDPVGDTSQVPPRK